MNKALFLATAAAALTLTACGGGGDTMADENAMTVNEAVGDLRDDPMMDNGMTADTAIPKTGMEFANMAAASDMYEIESSKLAVEKTKNADVRAFAQMLVTEHQKSTADLKAAGAKASPAITPKPMLNPEQTSNLEALRAASAADFDALYLGQQVPAHEKALAMLQGFAAGGDTPALKDFAAKTAVPVQKHLDRARELAR